MAAPGSEPDPAGAPLEDMRLWDPALVDKQGTLAYYFTSVWTGKAVLGRLIMQQLLWQNDKDCAHASMAVHGLHMDVGEACWTAWRRSRDHGRVG